MEELNADKALREQIFRRDKAMRDYDNDMALARAVGGARKVASIVTSMMHPTGKMQKEVLSILGISEEEYNQSFELLQQ